jgi:hypothetical protein
MEVVQVTRVEAYVSSQPRKCELDYMTQDVKLIIVQHGNRDFPDKRRIARWNIRILRTSS